MKVTISDGHYSYNWTKELTNQQLGPEIRVVTQFQVHSVIIHFEVLDLARVDDLEVVELVDLLRQTGLNEIILDNDCQVGILDLVFMSEGDAGIRASVPDLEMPP